MSLLGSVNVVALFASAATVLGLYALFGYAAILGIMVLFILFASGFLFYTLVLPRFVGGFWR